MKYKTIKFKIDPNHNFPFKEDKYCSGYENALAYLLTLQLILNIILLFII